MKISSSNTPEPQFPFSSARSLGWIFVALGTVSIVWPGIATMAVEQLIAWFFVLFGISGIMFWRGFRGVGVGTVGLVVAVMALVLGVVLVVQPMAGARTLTMVLASLFLVEGVLAILIALTMQSQFSGWIWGFLSGTATLLLAVMIFAGWPGTSVWIIGLLFGFHLLTTGIALLTIGGAGRNS